MLSNRRFAKSASVLAVLAAGLLCTTAFAKQRPLTPLPGQHGHVGAHLPPFHTAAGGTWSKLKNTYPGSFPDNPLVLTDGTVLEHEGCSGLWYKLTPDKNGSYVNGTWKQVASLPAGYAPLYFASAVLPNGNVIVEGGEYNNCSGVWTTKGAYYDTGSDTWTNVNPPSGWTTIGDAQAVVRTDGVFQLANCCTEDSALATISGNNVTWTILTSGQTGKQDNNDEEGWTLIPNNRFLTVDTWRGITDPASKTEIFDMNTNTWSDGNDTCSQLVDAGSHEVGAGVLLPNGFVFYIGGTAKNNVMDTLTGTWKCAPSFPNGFDSADGPAAVMPNGKVLAQVSPGVFNSPSHFYEVEVVDINTINLTQVSEPDDAPFISSYEGRMTILPSGQVFWTSDTGDIEIYTPTGKPNKAWKPKIKHVAATLSVGSKNNKLKGKNLNGFTEGGYYGDDAQGATNFPIVRFTNVGTGHVCYAKTHDHSTMGLSNGNVSTTKFDIPNSCETGASKIEVVVNGIASKKLDVTLN